MRSAVEFLSGLVRLQMEAGRQVIIEGRARDMPVLDEVFDRKGQLGKMLGPPSHVHWCALGIKNMADYPLCGHHVLYANFEWPSSSCTCKRQNKTHRSQAGYGYEQFCQQVLSRSGLVKPEELLPISKMWHETQRRMQSKTGAQQFAKEEQKESGDEVPAAG